MLEGVDDSYGYFLNIEVASAHAKRAEALACTKARELGLSIVGVEEITEIEGTYSRSLSRVISVSGKSYFPLEGH